MSEDDLPRIDRDKEEVLEEIQTFLKGHTPGEDIDLENYQEYRSISEDEARIELIHGFLDGCISANFQGREVGGGNYLTEVKSTLDKVVQELEDDYDRDEYEIVVYFCCSESKGI